PLSRPFTSPPTSSIAPPSRSPPPPSLPDPLPLYARASGRHPFPRSVEHVFHYSCHWTFHLGLFQSPFCQLRLRSHRLYVRLQCAYRILACAELSPLKSRQGSLQLRFDTFLPERRFLNRL